MKSYELISLRGKNTDICEEKEIGFAKKIFTFLTAANIGRYVTKLQYHALHTFEDLPSLKN